MRLKLETIARDSSQVDVELQLSAYAERLAAWPIETVERVLAEWPSRSKFWPAWQELVEQLPDLVSTARRLAASGDRERFSDRATRLKLHRRLGSIGNGRWKVLMERHENLADHQAIMAVERLDRGLSAFVDDDQAAPFTRRADWFDFASAMRDLSDPDIPCHNRAGLLRMGAKIEARQGPNAERMGWA